jgi:polyhydroxyalkanoate synthesis regulator phasin
MKDLKSQLEEKTKRLDQLVKSRPKAFCSTVNSSAEDVKRESEIDELEVEIKQLEKKVKSMGS